MSASLIELHVGGIRGLHWHTEAEWAFVLSGTCRQALHIRACPFLSQQAGAALSTASSLHVAQFMIKLRHIAVIRAYTYPAQFYHRRHRSSRGTPEDIASPKTAFDASGVL